MKLAIAVCLLLGIAAIPADMTLAQPGAAASKMAEPVLIPFDPPLDRPLRYRLTRTRGTGATSQIIAVTFTRHGEGYRLSASFDSPQDIRDDPSLALMSGPMIFNVESDGTISSLENEEQWWATAEQLFRTSGVVDPAAKRGMEALIARLRAAPRQARLDLLAQHHQSLTQFGATDMVPGEPVNFGHASDALLGQIEQEVSVTLAGVESGRGRFVMVQRLSAEQMAAMLGNLTGMIDARGLGDAFEGMSGERRSEFEVDVATGLTTRLVASMTINGAPGGPVTREIHRIERLPD